MGIFYVNLTFFWGVGGICVSLIETGPKQFLRFLFFLIWLILYSKFLKNWLKCHHKWSNYWVLLATRSKCVLEHSKKMKECFPNFFCWDKACFRTKRKFDHFWREKNNWRGLHVPFSFKMFSFYLILFTIYRLIWNQTNVRLVPNQPVNGKYNQIKTRNYLR